MKTLSGREFARLVELHGWLLRINESHHIYGKPGSVVRLSIPIHANRPLKSYQGSEGETLLVVIAGPGNPSSCNEVQF